MPDLRYVSQRNLKHFADGWAEYYRINVGELPSPVHIIVADNGTLYKGYVLAYTVVYYISKHYKIPLYTFRQMRKSGRFPKAYRLGLRHGTISPPPEAA